MSVALSTLLLAVAVSLAWAGLDLLRKLLVREIPPVALVVLLTAGAAPVFAGWHAAAGWSAPAPGYWLPAAASVGLNVLANVALMTATRIAPLSVTVPLLSLTPAFTALLGVPLLGEVPTWSSAVGIVLVITGAVWIGRPPPGPSPLAPLPGRERGSNRLPPSSPSLGEEGRGGEGRVGGRLGEEGRGGEGLLRGLLLMAVTAVCWALAILFDKLAVARAAPAFHALVLNGGVAVGCLALLAGRGGLRGLGELSAVRRMRGTFTLGLVVSVAALALQLFALPLIAVGTLETLKRGIGNLAALSAGWLFLGEEVTPSKLLAVALMTAGVALVLR